MKFNEKWVQLDWVQQIYNRAAVFLYREAQIKKCSLRKKDNRIQQKNSLTSGTTVKRTLKKEISETKITNLWRKYQVTQIFEKSCQIWF